MTRLKYSPSKGFNKRILKALAHAGNKTKGNKVVRDAMKLARARYPELFYP